jgi:hypothetical protein
VYGARDLYILREIAIVNATNDVIANRPAKGK